MAASCRAQARLKSRPARRKLKIIKAFLAASNGFNGEVGQGYRILWSAAELSGADGYEIFEFRDDQL